MIHPLGQNAPPETLRATSSQINLRSRLVFLQILFSRHTFCSWFVCVAFFFWGGGGGERSAGCGGGVGGGAVSLFVIHATFIVIYPLTCILCSFDKSRLGNINVILLYKR